MDGTDGAKFATLQRAAEVEIESVVETVPMLHGYVCVPFTRKLCHEFCVGELWGLLKPRDLMNPTYPASLAA